MLRSTWTRLVRRSLAASGWRSAAVASASATRVAMGRRWVAGGVDETGGGSTASPLRTTTSATITADDSKKSLNITDLDLKLGDDLPPLLQYNEELVVAGSDLLDFVNSSPALSKDAEHAFVHVIEMLFRESFMAVDEQFAVVRVLLKALGPGRESRVDEACRTIQRALLPKALFEFLDYVDRTMGDLTAAQLESLEVFVQLVLSGRENDDEFVAALKRIESAVPGLFTAAPFVAVLQGLNELLLQSRLAHLLNEACFAFDAERSGRVKFNELEQAVEKVLPKHQAAHLLGCVEADVDGKFFFPRLSHVLLMGPDGAPQAEQTAPKAPSGAS